MGIATTDLTPVEQTAFLTVYARAIDSRWPRPILGDTLADEVVSRLDYDFTGLGVQTSASRTPCRWRGEDPDDGAGDRRDVDACPDGRPRAVNVLGY